MFRRQNNQQGRNDRACNIEIHEKPDAGELSGGIGNNAADQLPGFQISGSNDANEAALHDIPAEIADDGLVHYFLNDLRKIEKRSRKKKSSGKKRKNEIPLI